MPKDMRGVARQAIPGDDLVAEGGHVHLEIRVQCANWLDVNRVQVFLNGQRRSSLRLSTSDASPMV